MSFPPYEAESHEALTPGLTAAHVQTSLLSPRGVSKGGVTIGGAFGAIAAVVRMELAVFRIALEKNVNSLSGFIHLSYQEPRRQTDKKEECSKEKFFHYEVSNNTLGTFP